MSLAGSAIILSLASVLFAVPGALSEKDREWLYVGRGFMLAIAIGGVLLSSTAVHRDNSSSGNSQTSTISQAALVYAAATLLVEFLYMVLGNKQNRLRFQQWRERPHQRLVELAPFSAQEPLNPESDSSSGETETEGESPSESEN